MMISTKLIKGILTKSSFNITWKKMGIQSCIELNEFPRNRWRVPLCIPCSNLHLKSRAKTNKCNRDTDVPLRWFAVGSSLPSSPSGVLEPGLFQRIMKKFGKMEYRESKLRNGGFLLYEKCVDGIDFNKFVSSYGLSDTYYTWFLVTELHVWMVMVRAMHEGVEGRVVRNSVVECLWHDAKTRAGKLGEMSITSRKEQLAELNEQFMAALFMYDEGLQSDDRVLANALWKRLFQNGCHEAEILENMIHYVRLQVLHLETFSREDVLINGKISWLPLPKLYT